MTQALLPYVILFCVAGVLIAIGFIASAIIGDWDSEWLGCSCLGIICAFAILFILSVNRSTGDLYKSEARTYSNLLLEKANTEIKISKADEISRNAYQRRYNTLVKKIEKEQKRMGYKDWDYFNYYYNSNGTKKVKE